MFVSGGIWKYGSEFSGNTWQERSSWQWQPTLTAHDPAPPLALEEVNTDTVWTIAAGWGADVNSSGTVETPGTTFEDLAGISPGGVLWRWANRFAVAGITGTITKVELILRVDGVGANGGVHDIGPYGTAGTDDPQVDSGATMFSRCANTGQYLSNSAIFMTVGVRSIDLGAQAITDLAAAIAGVGTFAVSCKVDNETGTDVGSVVAEYIDKEHPPKLRVTTAAGSGPVTVLGRNAWSGGGTRSFDLASGMLADGRGAWALGGARSFDLAAGMNAAGVGALGRGGLRSGDVAAGMNADGRTAWGRGGARAADLTAGMLADARGARAEGGLRSGDVQAGANVSGRAASAAGGTRAADLVAGMLADARAAWARGDTSPGMVTMAQTLLGVGAFGVGGLHAFDLVAGMSAAGRAAWAAGALRSFDLAAGMNADGRGAWARGGTRSFDLAAGASLSGASALGVGGTRAADLVAGMLAGGVGAFGVGGTHSGDAAVQVLLQVVGAFGVGGTQAAALVAGMLASGRAASAAGGTSAGDVTFGSLALVQGAHSAYGVGGTSAADLIAGMEAAGRAAFGRGGSAAAGVDLTMLVGVGGAFGAGLAVAGSIAAGAALLGRAASGRGVAAALELLAGMSAAGRAASGAGGFAPFPITMPLILPGAAPWGGGRAPDAVLVVPVTLGGAGSFGVGRTRAGDVQAAMLADVLGARGLGGSRAADLIAGMLAAGRSAAARGQSHPGTAMLAWLVDAATSGAFGTSLLPAGCIHILRPLTLIEELSPTLDQTRQLLEDLGLRPYRVFFVVDTWSGGEPGVGTVVRTLEEIHPAPRVRGAGSLTTEVAGQRVEGDLRLDRISRVTFTREELKGMTVKGRRRSRAETFRIGVLARDQDTIQLYVPGEPVLERFGWKMPLTAAGHAIPHTVPPFQTDLMRDIAVQVMGPARQVLTDLGLRQYRIYFIRETWSGAEVGVGGVTYAYTEINPAPRVRFVSSEEEMHAGGRRLAGDAVLERIGRELTREQLRCLDPDGSPPPRNVRLHWGLEGRFSDSRMVELYTPASEPLLRALGWEISLRPEGVRIPPC